MVTLKNEANVLFVKLGAILLIDAMDRMIQEIVLTGPGGVMHPEKMQQRGFPRPGGAHHRNKLTLFDVNVDAAKDIGFGGSVLKKLFDIS